MKKMRGVITGADSATREIIITCPEGISGTIMGVEVDIVPLFPKTKNEELNNNSDADEWNKSI